MSFVGWKAGRRRSLTIAATVLYGLVVLASSFEHHDILCHLQNPQHCFACTATPLGSDPQTLATPPTDHLADAGRAVTRYLVAADSLLTVRSTGRSPPLYG